MYGRFFVVGWVPELGTVDDENLAVLHELRVVRPEGLEEGGGQPFEIEQSFLLFLEAFPVGDLAHHGLVSLEATIFLEDDDGATGQTKQS